MQVPQACALKYKFLIAIPSRLFLWSSAEGRHVWAVRVEGRSCMCQIGRQVDAKYVFIGRSEATILLNRMLLVFLKR